MFYAKNLVEFFVKFEKYRTSKKDIAKKLDYREYVHSPSGSFKSRKIGEDKWEGTDIYETLTYSFGRFINKYDLEDELQVSFKDIHKIDLKHSDWLSYEEKIDKVLKDIWETGEIKNTYGLDLNWPRNLINNSKEQSADSYLEANNEKPKENQGSKQNYSSSYTSSQPPKPSFWERKKGFVLGFSAFFIICLVVVISIWKINKKRNLSLEK